MKKIVLIISLLALTIGAMDAQTPPSKNVRKYYDDSQLELIKKMPKPLMRIYEFMHRRAYPYDNVPDGARVKAIQQMDGMMHSKNVKALTLAQQPVWRPIGPYDIGGRIKAIAVHPTVDGTVYIGAAAGGIWKTTDAGTSWVPIFDDQNGIAFGAIAIDPNNPSTIYAGTGEAVSGAGGGKNGGTPIYLGAGMFKSTDDGTTWQLIGLTNVGTFSKVCVHPLNSSLIFAGGAYTGEGFYRSTDAGQTWEQTLDKSITDITINPNDTNKVFAAAFNTGVYYSSDAGKTWKLQNNGLPAGMGRIAVQLAPTNPNTLYLLTDANSASIYKSTDNGQSWNISYQGDASFFSGQGWYDMYITVDPGNEKVVLAGGIDTWKTSDGGNNWTNTTQGYSGGNTHVDHHCSAFNPQNLNEVYLGNDGGIYKSEDMGDSWAPVNNNVQVTQFYSLAIDNSRKNRNFGGTQDNGTLGNLSTNQWSNIIGGDGFRVIVDPINPNIVYGESQYGNLRKINVSTMTGQSINTGIPSGDQGLFDSPLFMDPTYNNILYSGRHALYVTQNSGTSWDVILSQRTNQINTIASSPNDENIIVCGTTVGELFITTDGGNNGDASWQDVSQNGLVNRFVTDIEFSLSDDKTFFVTFSGYGSPHVFKTTDLGKSWKNIGNGLPDIPVNAITLHPDNPDWIFIATDVGVFATFDGGNSWLPFGRGLPRSPVHDISFQTNRVVLPQLTLRVATHGRSMWEIDVPSDVVTDAEITSPAGGEIFTGGSTVPISWYGLGTTPLLLEYSTNDGNNWNTIANNVTGTEYNWIIPTDKIGFLCRVRITQGANEVSGGKKPDKLQYGQVLISRSFTINKIERGSLLLSGSVKFVPYGVAYDGKGGLWATSFYGNKIYKLNADNLEMIKSINIKGDSLFTDLSYDKQKNLMWVHHMYNTSGSGGGEIIEIDTTGKILYSLKSPATSYPIGLELVDGNLLVGDRDGERKLYLIRTGDGSNVINPVLNPYQKTYGPRGLAYDGKQFVYQVCTDFPNGGSLNESLIMKIDKNNLGAEVDRLSLQTRNSGIINGRGIDFDPRDSSFWITDFGGNIYKIAGFNPPIQASNLDLTITGSNTVCQNDTLVYSTTTENNVTISWRAVNGSIIGSNNGSIINVLWNNAGTGNIVLIKDNTSSGKTDSSSLNVTINNLPPKPVISKDFNTLISSSAAGNQWYKDGNPISGATSNTFSATVNGNYTVRVTLNGCSSLLSDVFNFEYTSSDFNLTITGSNSVCQNDTLTYLTTAENNVKISWRADNGSIIGSNSDSIITVIWNNAGTGNIVLTKENTSTSKKDSASLSITINVVPPKPTITKNSNTLNSSAPTGNQWYFSGKPISGATNNTYIPTKDGIYTVKVTLNGCSSLFSDGINVITDVKEQSTDNAILDTRIYPNPMTDFAIISFRLQTHDAQVKVQIYNVLDELTGTFFDRRLQEGQAEYFQISVGKLSPGFYFVVFYVDGRQVNVEKMVVAR